MTSGIGSELHAAIAGSGHGSRLAFTNLVLQFDLWAIPTNTDLGAAAGDPRRITDDLSWEFFPSLSSDAAFAVYSSRRGELSSLCVRDLRSSRETTVLTSAGEITSPRISGDGNWVFFRSQGVLSRVGTRGGVTAQLCKACGSPTGISADNETIMIEPDDTEDVKALDARTGKVATVVAARGSLFGGQPSPDGNWVVFHERKENASTQIFVARLSDHKAGPPDSWIPVTPAGAANQGPQWSPDGNAIYFRSDRDGSRCIWVQRLDPRTKNPVGAPAATQHFHHARRSLQHLRSFDDRTRIAVGKGVVLAVVGELRGNVWMREAQNTQ